MTRMFGAIAAVALLTLASLAPAHAQASGPPTDVLPAGDLDGDGIADVLLVHSERVSSSDVQSEVRAVRGVDGRELWALDPMINAQIYPSTGADGAPVVIFAETRYPSALTAAWVTITVVEGSGAILWQRQFVGRGVLPLFVDAPSFYGVADGNRDGITDVLVGFTTVVDALEAYVSTATTVSYLSGIDGSQFGAFTLGPEVDVTHSALPFPDFSGDGIGDYIVLSEHHDPTAAPTLTLTAVTSDTHSAMWTSAPLAMDAYLVSLPSAGDTNGDGRADIIVQEDASHGEPFFWPPALALLDGRTGSLLWQTYGAYGRAVGDVDGDGLNDVALETPVFKEDAMLGVRYEARSGSGNVIYDRLYSVPTDAYSVDYGPTYFASPNAGDLDGDGHTDTVHILQSPDFQAQTVHSDMGAVSGTDGSKQWLSRPGVPLLGSVTSPGDDLLLASVSGTVAIVSLQAGETGDTVWSSPVQVPDPIHDTSISTRGVADVTGDGVPEVFAVLQSSYGASLGVVLSGANGSRIL